MTTLFATFLGYNPVAHLLGHAMLAALPPAQAAILTGRGFFPRLITQPFSAALSAAFTFAVITCLLAAAASLLRGGRYEWSAAADQVAGRAAPTRRTPASAP